MSGEERRGKIIQALKNSDKAVSATTLAKEFDVSRQVIVQDVALLRANGKNIFSTNRGYLIQEDEETTRVFKVQHEDDEVEKELTTIVDLLQMIVHLMKITIIGKKMRKEQPY